MSIDLNIFIILDILFQGNKMNSDNPKISEPGLT